MLTNFSVVIPLYNKEAYILRAIRSIINQTFHPREIIIVDDGSTDNSAEKILSLNIENITLITQENAGAAAARNRGVKAAQGNLVAFLDADDEWKPDFLSTIVKLVHLFPNCGMYATSIEIIKRDNIIVYPKLTCIPPVPWKGLINNLFDLFQEDWPFNPSSTCIPKKIYEEVGGCPEGVVISEDVYLWIKIYIHYSIAFDPISAAIYHWDAKSRITQSIKPLKEMPYNKLIIDAIQNLTLPIDQHNSALDFIAQKKIWIAVNNIEYGNRKYARFLLNSCKDRKKYTTERLYWYFYSFLPSNFGKIIKIIKYYISRVALMKNY